MPEDDQPLLEALSVIRQRGAIGEASLAAAVQRSDAFVVSVPVSARTLIDLGSGGGLPGLVLAWRRPELAVTLVERRHTRADMLTRATRALGLDDRCHVRAADVRSIIGEVQRVGTRWDAVTARSFGPPATTLEFASALCVDGGTIVIGEPPKPNPERWPTALLSRLEVTDMGYDQGVRRFLRQ
jgi:16S rRNA G527 N7-methylase RsmG